MDVHKVRQDFPALSRQIDGRPVIYLDNAATTLKPRLVIDAVTRFYERNGANIHRGKHYLSEEASDAYEHARYKVAQYVGVYGNEVVFVRNTTEAVNLVAAGLGLGFDDVVVGSLDSHHSQILPWRRVANLKLTRVTPDGQLDLDHFHELLKLGPKVVALTHYSNVTGAIAPIKVLAEAAKQACDAIVVVDAAQSLPHVGIDLAGLPIDFLAFSGHKMLAPTGVGCLIGARGALERLRPAVVGGGMVDWVDLDGSRERKIPHRLEAGTPAISGALGLGAAITYLEQLGVGRDDHERALSERLFEAASARDYIELMGPRCKESRSPLATFRIRGCDSLADYARSLSDAYGVMCRSGHMCAQPIVDAMAQGEVLRVSAYVYNTTTEIDAAFSALDELVKMFGP